MLRTKISSSSLASSTSSGSEPKKYENQLRDWCISHSVPEPAYQYYSDKRGGRTAWSCAVIVDRIRYNARFHYDGQYAHNAKEDAANEALKALGELPATGVGRYQVRRLPSRQFPSER